MDEVPPPTRYTDWVDRAAHTVGVICAGMFAGASLYINVVHVPSLKHVSGPTLINQFGDLFHRAKLFVSRLQAGSATIGSTLLLSNYFAREKRNPNDAVGGVLLGAVVPFTLAVMMPTVNALLNATAEECSADTLTGGARFASLVQRWDQMHFVRTLLSLTSFLVLAIEPVGAL